MKGHRKQYLLSVLLGMMVSGYLLAATSQKEEGTPERFKAVNVQAKTAKANPATQLDILVEKYTTDNERQGYAKLLKEQGPDALRRTLEKVNVGQISVPGAVGVPIAVARIRETDGGRRIRLVTTRSMSFLQVRRGDSSDYPYTVMDLYLDENAKGKGSVLTAVKIFFDDQGQLQAQAVGGDPLELINVEKVD